MSSSFGKTAKDEIAFSPLHNSDEELAFLSGLIHTAGTVTISHGGMELSLPLENMMLKDRTVSLLEKACRGLSEISSDEKRVLLSGAACIKALDECKIYSLGADGERHISVGIDPSLVEKESAAAAYLKGAFLGDGSVSLSAGYHLEFVLSNGRLANDLADILRLRGINANVTERKDKFVCYVKGADGVSDTLALLGARKAVLELNNKFVGREIAQRVNRLNNCDLANIDKSVSAALRQQEAIDELRSSGRYENLPQKLKEAAVLREENPEMTLSELSVCLGISKSGMKHRLNKLIELASKK